MGNLPHAVPLWIDPSQETYYLTFCCEPRGKNQLAVPDAAKAILETIEHRQNEHVWHVHLFLLMPDHAHALMTFPPGRLPFRTRLSKWKEWTAKTIRIQWQLDFFEHRLRSEESLREKADYILHNPVRAGLASKASDWPHVWLP